MHTSEFPKVCMLSWRHSVPSHISSAMQQTSRRSATMTTKTPRLSATDFMMMDVHEPLSPEEINEINPQAAVDKTLGAEQDEVGADEGVDSSPARCEFCFGPRPCPDHPNVEPLSVVTSLACPPMTM